MAKITPYDPGNFASSAVGTPGVDHSGEMGAATALNVIQNQLQNKLDLQETVNNAANRMNQDDIEFRDRQKAVLDENHNAIQNNLNEISFRQNATAAEIRNTEQQAVAGSLYGVGDALQARQVQQQQIAREHAAALQQVQAFTASAAKELAQRQNEVAVGNHWVNLQDQLVQQANSSMTIDNPNLDEGAYANDFKSKYSDIVANYLKQNNIDDSQGLPLQKLANSFVNSTLPDLHKFGTTQVNNITAQNAGEGLAALVQGAGTKGPPGVDPLKFESLGYNLERINGYSRIPATVGGKQFSIQAVNKSKLDAIQNWASANINSQGTTQQVQQNLERVRLAFTPMKDGQLPINLQAKLQVPISSEQAQKVLDNVTARGVQIHKAEEDTRQNNVATVTGQVALQMTNVSGDNYDNPANIKRTADALTDYQNQLKQMPDSKERTTALNQVSGHLNDLTKRVQAIAKGDIAQSKADAESKRVANLADPANQKLLQEAETAMQSIPNRKKGDNPSDVLAKVVDAQNKVMAANSAGVYADENGIPKSRFVQHMATIQTQLQNIKAETAVKQNNLLGFSWQSGNAAVSTKADQALQASNAGAHPVIIQAHAKDDTTRATQIHAQSDASYQRRTAQYLAKFPQLQGKEENIDPNVRKHMRADADMDANNWANANPAPKAAAPKPATTAPTKKQSAVRAQSMVPPPPPTPVLDPMYDPSKYKFNPITGEKL